VLIVVPDGAYISIVMAGLDPAIHVLMAHFRKGVDHRDKPGDDD